MFDYWTAVRVGCDRGNCVVVEGRKPGRFYLLNPSSLLPSDMGRVRVYIGGK